MIFPSEVERLETGGDDDVDAAPRRRPRPRLEAPVCPANPSQW